MCVTTRSAEGVATLSEGGVALAGPPMAWAVVMACSSLDHREAGVSMVAEVELWAVVVVATALVVGSRITLLVMLAVGEDEEDQLTDERMIIVHVSELMLNLQRENLVIVLITVVPQPQKMSQHNLGGQEALVC